MRRDVARSLELTAKRFDIEPQITARLLRGGHRIHEVPVRFDPRSRAQGKKIGWRDGVRALQVPHRRAAAMRRVGVALLHRPPSWPSGSEVGELRRRRVGFATVTCTRPSAGPRGACRCPSRWRSRRPGRTPADVCSGRARAVARPCRARSSRCVRQACRSSWRSFVAVGGIAAAALVVPLFGALLIWGTYLAGSRFGARVGVASAGLAACSPVFLYQLVQPMSDVPAAACWMLAVAAVTGNAPAWRRARRPGGGDRDPDSPEPRAAGRAAWSVPAVRPERRWRQRLQSAATFGLCRRRRLPRRRGDSTDVLRLRAQLGIRHAGGDLQPRSGGAERASAIPRGCQTAHAGLDAGRGRAVPAAGRAHASVCRPGPRQCRLLPAVRRLRSLVVPAVSAADAAARRDHGGGGGRRRSAAALRRSTARPALVVLARGAGGAVGARGAGPAGVSPAGARGALRARGDVCRSAASAECARDHELAERQRPVLFRPENAGVGSARSRPGSTRRSRSSARAASSRICCSSGGKSRCSGGALRRRAPSAGSTGRRRRRSPHRCACTGLTIAIATCAASSRRPSISGNC